MNTECLVASLLTGVDIQLLTGVARRDVFNNRTIATKALDYEVW